MLSEEEKKEIREDACNTKRRRAFEVADKNSEAFKQKYISDLTVDKVIKFLMDAQEVRGPFPISKIALTVTRNFKL